MMYSATPTTCATDMGTIGTARNREECNISWSTITVEVKADSYDGPTTRKMRRDFQHYKQSPAELGWTVYNFIAPPVPFDTRYEFQPRTSQRNKAARYNGRRLFIN